MTEQFDDSVDSPNMVCDASFHREGDAQRLMHAAETVVHLAKRDCPEVIFVSAALAF